MDEHAAIPRGPRGAEAEPPVPPAQRLTDYVGAVRAAFDHIIAQMQADSAYFTRGEPSTL